MVYTISEKTAFEGTYSSRGITCTFSPEDVGLDATKFPLEKSDLLWWNLVFRATERFLTVLVVQGKITSEQRELELSSLRAIVEHLEK